MIVIRLGFTWRERSHHFVLYFRQFFKIVVRIYLSISSELRMMGSVWDKWCIILFIKTSLCLTFWCTNIRSILLEIMSCWCFATSSYHLMVWLNMSNVATGLDPQPWSIVAFCPVMPWTCFVWHNIPPALIWVDIVELLSEIHPLTNSARLLISSFLMQSDLM